MEPRKPWKGTMTQRDRFNAQMHYRPFDRTVNMEFGYWAENYQTWDIFLENNIHNEWEADRFFAFEPPAGVGGHYDMTPGFEEKVLEVKAHSVVKTTSEGLVVEVPKDGHSSIPRYLGSAVETPEDWKALKERSFDRAAAVRKPDFERLDKICADDRTYPVGISCGSMIGKVRDLLTVEGLAYAIADYPEMVADIVETRCELVEDYLDAVLPEMDDRGRSRGRWFSGRPECQDHNRRHQPGPGGRRRRNPHHRRGVHRRRERTLAYRPAH